MVEEAKIEAGIVGDQRAVVDELHQVFAQFMEARLVGKKGVAEAVDGLRFARHRPAGIEIGMEGAAGLDPVHQLDAPYLDHAVSGERAEARRLRSEEHTSELQSLMRISYA